MVGLAIAFAAQARAQTSDSVSRLLKLARAHYEEGRVDSALTYDFAALRLARATRDQPWEAAALNNIGVVYDASGRPDSALIYHRLALSSNRARGNPEGEADSFNNIGVLYLRIGNVDSALANLRAALAYRHRASAREDEVSTLGSIGAAYGKIGEPDSALRYYRVALAMARDAGIRDGELRVMKNIADLYRKTGPPDSAMRYYQAILEDRRAEGDSAGEANALNNIGVLYDHIGRGDSAIAAYRAALPIFRALGDRHGEATALGNIGFLMANLGRADSALSYDRAALALFRAEGDRASIGTTLSNIGVIFSDMGQPDSALAYHRASLPLQREAHDRDGEATALGNIGAAYDKIGQLDSALVYHRAALTIRRQIGDKEGEAVSVGSLGLVHSKLGRADSALYYARAALPLYRALGDPRGEATILNDIAVQFYQADQPDSALSYYRAALTSQRAAGDRSGQANTLANIGVLYNALHRSDSALVVFRQALSFSAETGDKPEFATTLTHIGETYRLLSRFDSALVYFRAALPVNRAAADRNGEAITLTNIGEVYAATGPKPLLYKAAQYLDSAAAIYASLRTRSGADANAIAYAEKERAVFNGWAAIWVQLIREEEGAARERAIYAALAATERGRAQGLRDLLATNRANDNHVAPARSARGEWPTDTVPGADLYAEANNALTPLVSTHTAALYYFLAKDSVLVSWLIYPTGDVKFRISPTISGDSLGHLITTMRGGVGADRGRRSMTRDASYLSERESPKLRTRGVDDEEAPAALVERAASVVSNELLPPGLLQDIPEGSELVVVPHGMLGLVPFAALTAAGDSIPLGVRYALRYAPSLRALGAVEQKSAAGTAMLFVGDPLMPSVRDASGRAVVLRQLPAAKEEATVLAHRVGASALSGSAATETVVRSQLPSARLAHLATHGLAYGSEARVRDSYVALAPDAQNDGLLTIGELLDNVAPLSADLVVLSACQTGLGDLKNAEGTVGFQRAFLAKGARSVLVSLWSVDDKATLLLMDRFYSHWLGAERKPVMSKAEALRRAQQDVRLTKGYESPKYWAAFQLVGAR